MNRVALGCSPRLGGRPGRPAQKHGARASRASVLNVVTRTSVRRLGLHCGRCGDRRRRGWTHHRGARRGRASGTEGRLAVSGGTPLGVWRPITRRSGRARDQCVPIIIERGPLLHRRKQRPARTAAVGTADRRSDPPAGDGAPGVSSLSGNPRRAVPTRSFGDLPDALSVGDGDRRLEAVVEGDGKRRGDALESFLVMAVVTDHHLRPDEPRVTKFVETAVRRCP